ncbi:serine protease [Nesterenkonia sp. AY15]|uniref:trypsin-like serine peptidase n=1 Tax=Nesterenkonia sp. AY15 TaxID=2901139 RepID=UPI001F4CDF42|nr:serine protease [Nesterenkonia sp. AY15]MCH8572229.1 serine protease [Nesterenkonia sp. AY15]
MNESTYQIFGQVDGIDPSTGQPSQQFIPFGTGWAVDERLLATNAHVAGAFVETAEAGIQLSRAVAVQSGTGTVVRILREVTHPSYAQDPLGSPDVALLTTQEVLSNTLELASPDSILDLGDEFHLVGFPGDVDTFISQRPGETIPQATSLNGTISARRAHSPDQEVTPETLAVYQHQAPTTPGTSGSAMVHCGEVAGINNAGTVRLVLELDENGELASDRQSAAANNFGVHVRFIHEILDLFEADAVPGNSLPLPAVVSEPAGDEEASGGQTEESSETYSFTGEVQGSHRITFDLSTETGEINGMAQWGTGTFLLVGTFDLETLEFSMTDDAPEQNSTVPRGFYVGQLYEDGTFEGNYSEDGESATYFQGNRTG